VPKLPHVSGAQTILALERLGFAVIRQRGSHVILRRGSSGCVAPNHREIKVGTLSGTLSGILKQAGITADEFLAALRKKA
jgi:predicted RNA binding protein YcfA (HicA-like mRNA interferase family)